ncbi:hypothetical protein N1851_013294 [Merluccius polli]|uniref:Uncharacterized protein n=1 Tax=Merluccius polli TaxID=89951 RepID=A0AA47MV81_MERPO|nr:hypothetical protein N1851_013294 [Merluccius polli]
MSRSASKSHADKRASVQVASPSQDLPVEVVPGRLTQTQWEDMLRLEDTDDLVGEIMEELVGNVMERCLKTYIHKQLVAFSVSWAKGFLVQALELQFLYRDEGDGPEEASSDAEDSEPVPSPIDSWAQGCVPVVYVNSPPSPPHTTPQEVVRMESTEPKSTRPPCAPGQMTRTEPQEKDREMSGPADNSTQRVVTRTPAAKSNRKKKMKVQLNPNIAAKPSVQSPRQSLSRSVIKGDQDEGEKRMVYSKSTDRFDLLPTSDGRQPMSKRHHALRPPQLILPQYEILDTQLLPKRQTIRGLPVSGHRYNKQCTESTTIKVLKPLSNCTDQKAKLQQRRNTQPGSNAVYKEKGIKTFCGSLRLDNMDLAPGVSLSESQRIWPLTASITDQSDITAALRPMRRYPALPMLTTEQRSTGTPAQARPPK